MRNVLRAVVAFLIACAPRSAPLPPAERRPQAPVTQGAPSSAASLEVGGWLNYWDLAAGMQDVHSVRGSLSDVFLFMAHLDDAATPILARPDLDGVLRAVREAGARPWLTIVNDVADSSGKVQLKDAQAIHGMLADPDRRAAHRAGVVALARRQGVSGVDIDYERVLASDRQGFTTFISELRRDLDRAGIALSVTVQPKFVESSSDGSGSADWAALCESVDRLQIMLYNEHSGRTGPGPVASPAFVERVLRFALTQCSADKLVAAIKAVGIEWASDGTHDVPFGKALLATHAEKARVSRGEDDVPWISDEEQQRTIYYEDARSLVSKLRVVQRLGIQRVVLWTLGGEDPSFWDAAAGLIRTREVPIAEPVTPRRVPERTIRTASRSSAPP
jgi:spore germination protein YaaH